jgi:hypothetical protein
MDRLGRLTLLQDTFRISHTFALCRLVDDKTLFLLPAGGQNASFLSPTGRPLLERDVIYRDMSKQLVEDLKGYIRDNRDKETFPVMLERLRVERSIKPSDLYNGAGVSRGYYWKMMGQRHPNISKKIAIAYGIVLELDRETMDALLRSAGYALSNNSGFDLVVRYCVERRIYNIKEICDIADTVCKEVKIPVQGENIYAGKPDIDIDKFDSSEDAGKAGRASEKRKTNSDSFTDLLERITERLDDFTEELGDGADCLDEEQFAEDDMSEDEAAVYQKAQQIAEPLVSLLNSMAEKLERAAGNIVG